MRCECRFDLGSFRSSMTDMLCSAQRFDYVALGKPILFSGSLAYVALGKPILFSGSLAMSEVAGSSDEVSRADSGSRTPAVGRVVLKWGSSPPVTLETLEGSPVRERRIKLATRSAMNTLCRHGRAA
jgi:hypothetical protein